MSHYQKLIHLILDIKTNFEEDKPFKIIEFCVFSDLLTNLIDSGSYDLNEIKEILILFDFLKEVLDNLFELKKKIHENSY